MTEANAKLEETKMLLFYPDGSPAIMPAPHPIYNPTPNYAELLGKKRCPKCEKMIRDKPIIGTLHICSEP